MTTDDELDRLLEEVLMDGPAAAPTRVLSFALDAVAQRPQRHPIVAWLDREAWPHLAPVTARFRPTTSLILILLALLIVLTTAILAVGGDFIRRTETPVVRTTTPVDALDAVPGPALVYGHRSGGLFVAGADGTEARPILAGGWYIHPRLSSDRRWIAADAAGTLGRSFVILRSDGSVALEFPVGDAMTTYSWGAAGASAGWLAAAMDGSIVVVDPASDTRLTIDTGETTIQALAWSPDAPVLWWAAVRPGSGDRYDGYTAADVHMVRLGEKDGTVQIADQESITLDLDPVRAARELEQIAVSPDGRTLALRARITGWLRSDLLVVDVDGGVPTYLNPAPPQAPWLTASSGIRWLPDGSGVVAEVGGSSEMAIVRPTVVPIDGTPPRPIDVGRLSVDDGGVVESSGPVLPKDTAILVGGARSGLDVQGPQTSVPVHDLWVADADGRGSHLVATETLGGDLR